MADPLSILGAALGVISLGLQVREEITSYCKAWRGVQEEIQDVANKAQGLEAPLKALREIIKEAQVSNPEIAYDLQNKIETLRGGIQKVQNAVDQWKPAASAESFGDKMRARGKRAAYPFRKEALRSLANDLSSIQVDLQTTLHHLELQQISKVSSPPPPKLLRDWCDEQHAIKPRRGSNVAIKKYSYYNRLLNITIAASFRLSRGAGGFSIAPSLTLRVPLSPNHPGFFSIYIHGLSAKSQRPQEFVDNTVDLLKYLFTTGQASPLDLGSDGNSFLDAACYAFSCSAQWHPDAYIHFVKLFMFLIHSGAPLSTSTSLAGTGLDKYLGSVELDSEKTRMLCRLAHRGGIITVNGAFQSPRSKSNLRQVLDENEEVVDIPDVAKALIQQSEHDLQIELQSGRASVNNVIGNTTLLQLAIGWPRGIRILADAGIDMHRMYPLPPLHMAMRERDYDSVKALLEAGHPLGPSGMCMAESLDDNNEMSTLLVLELKARRQRLARLGQANIPKKDLARMGMVPQSDSPVPDIVAYQITTLLQGRGVIIDPAIEVKGPSKSVYHQPIRKTDTLDLLFEHGFKDLDATDSSGKTPLMIMSSASGIFETSNSRRQWLISKGADPNRPLPWGDGTVLHFLGTCFASMLALEIAHTDRSVLRQFEAPETAGAEHEHKDPLPDLCFVLQASCRDGCICACSVGGCTPLLAALRHLLTYTPRFYSKNGKNRFPGSLNFVISRSDKSVEADLAIIRLMTFDALDLRHTCCRKHDDYADPKLQYMDPREVQEIRDEESILLEEFDHLNDEVVAEFKQLDLSVMEFLQGPWYKRVMKYVNRLDDYDERHARNMKEIGLELHATEVAVSDRISLMLGLQVEEIED